MNQPVSNSRSSNHYCPHRAWRDLLERYGPWEHGHPADTRRPQPGPTTPAGSARRANSSGRQGSPPRYRSSTTSCNDAGNWTNRDSNRRGRVRTRQAHHQIAEFVRTGTLVDGHEQVTVRPEHSRPALSWLEGKITRIIRENVLKSTMAPANPEAVTLCRSVCVKRQGRNPHGSHL